MLIMIGHFSKWTELAPFWDKSNERAIYAFWDQVLNKFGVVAKVLLDQGINFKRN
jgi:hypothetical protein